MSAQVVDDALAPYRRALERARRRQESHNLQTLYFARDAQRDVLGALAEDVDLSVVRLQVVAPSRASLPLEDAAVWRDLASTGVDVRTIYLVAHLGILDETLKRRLREDASQGINARIANIAWISDALASAAVSDCVLVDGRVLLFSPPLSDGDASGLWTLTAAEEHVSAAESMLLGLWDAARPVDELPVGLDLEEPLAESARLIGDVAPVLCVGDHVDPTGCTWYHGSWQYLRLMNMVSTPSWHHDFYSRELGAAIDRGSQSCLVSGTADYSVFAYLIASLGDSASKTRMTVVDRCNTPLFACQWYAKRVGLPVTTVSEDIHEYATSHHGAHDLILTDAFLTRFTGDESVAVLDDWYGMLNDGGIVVTTIRIHSGPPRGQSPEEAVASFRERASVRWRRWEPFIGMDRQTISKKAEDYARRMISNPIGNESTIINLLESKFRVLRKETSSVPGELYPTEYMRVVLGKG